MRNHSRVHTVATSCGHSRIRCRESRMSLWLVAAGTALVAITLARATITGDLLDQLGMAVDLVQNRHVRAVGQPMSGGGAKPGALYQLLLGLPMFVWYDYRASRVLIGALAVAALFLVRRLARDFRGEAFAAWYVAIFALSPWLHLHLGDCVDISFLALPALVVLWACWRLRERAHQWPSFVLGLSLMALFQLHGSFVVPVIAVGMLAVRRRIRVGWSAFALGVAVGALTLIPTAMAALHGSLPPVAPRDGYAGLGLVQFYPLLKAVGFWMRMGAPDIGKAMHSTVFLDRDWIAAGPGHAPAAAAAWVLYASSLVMVIPGVAASVWMARGCGGAAAQDPVIAWLRTVVGAYFAAVLASAALSPVVLQGWHLIVAYPVACIPPALWIHANWSTGTRRVRAVMLYFVSARVPVTLAIIAGHGWFCYQPPVPPALYSIVPPASRASGLRCPCQGASLPFQAH